MRRRKETASTLRSCNLCGGIWAPLVLQMNEAGVTTTAQGWVQWQVTCERTIQAFWGVTPHCLWLFLLCGWSFVWCLVGLELSPACGTPPACLAPDCPCDATTRLTAPQPFPAPCEGTGSRFTFRVTVLPQKCNFKMKTSWE